MVLLLGISMLKKSEEEKMKVMDFTKKEDIQNYTKVTDSARKKVNNCSILHECWWCLPSVKVSCSRELRRERLK